MQLCAGIQEDTTTIIFRSLSQICSRGMYSERKHLYIAFDWQQTQCSKMFKVFISHMVSSGASCIVPIMAESLFILGSQEL